MSNRSGLPSLDELSEWIAENILEEYWVYEIGSLLENATTKESLSRFIAKKILEISTQEK